MQIPPETFLIDRAAALPLQVQLRRQIVLAVHEGRLRPGFGSSALGAGSSISSRVV